ncbi:protein of unknown function [Desulfotomaculum arcticum]|uniref:SLH domain-containing protein n=1 Tax=Desulfotruncus arcticus DSM 17038 TaxID=1121424 RepID=A0A1I2T0T2_9FIRM|nr:S-layer homology domain-containing protein [Desulfotruncus arcticus]SFG56787.1 protein of unknown function [Desulfotomaculum arcticum] [Desulfotruncus arcticus DSM 17038]
MKISSKRFLSLLMVLALVLCWSPPALAADNFTAELQQQEHRLTITGTTTPDTAVTLLVTGLDDGDKKYSDQTKSGGDGAYAFSFVMDEGGYRATVTSNGIHIQQDFAVGNYRSAAVTVRVEGSAETLLPRTEVPISDGETTLLEAVLKAFNEKDVPYEMQGDMIHAIRGETGWQWLLNSRGGMAVPGTRLHDGDEIVLVDDLIWDPTITRLTVTPASIAVGAQFTVTLEKLDGTSASPVPGQPVVFNSEIKTTDSAGQTSFTPGNQGSFSVTCEPTTGSLIRPVPVKITVSGSGGSNPGTDPVGSSITVKMRIEGYRDTIMDGYVTFNPEDYKGEEGKYRFTGPDGVEYVNDRATVLLATVMAWNQNGIRDNSVGYQDNYVARMAGEEEFDFESGHPTCGWLVRVNNKLINEGVGVWPVRDGDKIEWYYGDVNSYFGSMEVTPTSLKTGEQLKVKVFGRSNGGMSMSNTSRKEPMEEAAVYVGSEEYTTGANGEVEITMKNPGTFEVYAVKLDKDASSGGCYFPLMSRTEKVRVKVTGESIETVVPVPEDPADAARIIKEVLDNPEADGNLVAETVKAAAISLANSLAKVQTAADAAALLDNTAAVTGLLDQAAGRITGDQAAATFAGSCLQITGVLAGLAPQISGAESKATLARAAVETIEAVAGILDRISDKAGLQETVDGLLDDAAPILASLQDQDAAAVQNSVLSLARQAARCLVQETLGADRLTMQDVELQAALDPGQAGELAGYAVQTVAGLEEKLGQMDLGQDLKLARQAVITIPGQGEKAVQVTLPAGTMDEVAAGGADSLAINTPEATFNLPPGAFGQASQDKDITLSAALVDPADLNNPAVPPGSIVVDLNAAAAGEAIIAFSAPLEVSLPYPGTPTAVTVYRIKADGSLEPMGGTYDSISGRVTFRTGHFSKYFAKETEKTVEIQNQFTDLENYAWAREAIEALAGQGIISGKGNGIFDPGADVTRAEFASLITRVLDQKAPQNTDLPFKDVSQDSWYHDAVAAAYAGGLVGGVSQDRFNPGNSISREEMAVIIARVLEQKGHAGGRAEDLAGFKDRDRIAAWAQDGAALAAQEGIITGVGDGRFTPADNTNRAQAAVMLYRLYGILQQ